MSLTDLLLRDLVEMSIELHAGWAGRARLTRVKRRCHRPRSKRSIASWSCCHAETVVDTEPGDKG